MLKRFLALIFILTVTVVSAQHKASVTATSDFKTIKNGVIESTFVLDSELSATELANFSEWTSQNASLGSFTLVGKTVVTSLKVDANDRNVYDKMFYMLGVDVLEVVVNGQKKPMDRDSFFAHFSL